MEPIASTPIDPPTLAMTFSVNDSPLAGREGTKVTSRMIAERLLREAEGNVAIEVRETADKDALEVAGRGELQLGVLIENMRREGFELSISRPRVLFQTVDGQRMEPIEEEQFPLGLLPVPQFDGRRLQMAPGELLVIATDGILEVCDKRGEEFWDVGADEANKYVQDEFTQMERLAKELHLKQD